MVVTSINDRRGTLPPHALRVLVVDDQLDEAESCAELLRRKGHHTHFAITGHEAIDRAATFAPHLILLDLGMPDMSGLEVITSLRESETSKPPVIAAVTGYESSHHRSLCAEAGFDQFVIKPVSIDAYDYLLWAAGAENALSLLTLPRDRKADFYVFALGQLQFGQLILDFAQNRNISAKLRSFEKVDRIRDRTTIWLGRSSGFTAFQLVKLHESLNTLRDRLIEMRFEAAIAPDN